MVPTKGVSFCLLVAMLSEKISRMFWIKNLLPVECKMFFYQLSFLLIYQKKRKNILLDLAQNVFTLKKLGRKKLKLPQFYDPLVKYYFMTGIDQFSKVINNYLFCIISGVRSFGQKKIRLLFFEIPNSFDRKVILSIAMRKKLGNSL